MKTFSGAIQTRPLGGEEDERKDRNEKGGGAQPSWMAAHLLLILQASSKRLKYPNLY
jgi:hypothetical protein